MIDDPHLPVATALPEPSEGVLVLLAGRLLLTGVVLAVWQMASGWLIAPIWISSPSRILARAIDWVSDGTLLYHLQGTMITIVTGYWAGAAVGVAGGLLLGLLPRVEQVAAPFISALWCLPKIALLPLFVIFLGIGLVSKVVLVASVVVFLVLYSTIDGVRDVDPGLVQGLRLMGASRREILMKVILPSSLPWIATGMRVSVSYALMTTVVGEQLISNRGLGYLIGAAAAGYDTAGVFTAVIVVILLSVATTEVLGRAERHLSSHGRH